MPREAWLTLLDVLGDGNVELVGSNRHHLPPAKMCRAQMWVSPAGQAAWTNYLNGDS